MFMNRSAIDSSFVAPRFTMAFYKVDYCYFNAGLLFYELRTYFNIYVYIHV